MSFAEEMKKIYLDNVIRLLLNKTSINQKLNYTLDHCRNIKIFILDIAIFIITTIALALIVLGSSKDSEVKTIKFTPNVSSPQRI